jgi:hypothetical protein
MANILVKSEALPIEVGERVFWLKLETRKVSSGGETPGTIQYWAFLPPGMRPAIMRGKERDAVIAEVRQAIVSQAGG